MPSNSNAQGLQVSNGISVIIREDVEFPNGHLDPDAVLARISSKTVGIMPVAYVGTDLSRDAVYAAAKERDLWVIEYDAHAFGSLTNYGQKIGSKGDIIRFSFDGIWNITCGEGGAVVTKDKEFAHCVRVL